MGECIISRRGGGGGASLNFNIVGGTTQPSSPAENTIWVNTPTAITDWAFSPQAPSNPTSGMVWFQTALDTNTPINALKKNGIWLYPRSCKQYVGGTWVNKTAKTYQGGSWKSWTLVLYDNGNLLVPMAWHYGSGNVNFEAEWIKLSGSGAAVCSTDSQIDLSPYSTLVVDVEKNSNGHCYIWWDKDQSDNPTGAGLFQGVVDKTTATRETVSVPIPAGTGKKYVGVSTANTTAWVYSIELR